MSSNVFAGVLFWLWDARSEGTTTPTTTQGIISTDSTWYDITPCGGSNLKLFCTTSNIIYSCWNTYKVYKWLDLARQLNWIHGSNYGKLGWADYDMLKALAESPNWSIRLSLGINPGGHKIFRNLLRCRIFRCRIFVYLFSYISFMLRWLALIISCKR